MIADGVRRAQQCGSGVLGGKILMKILYFHITLEPCSPIEIQFYWNYKYTWNTHTHTNQLNKQADTSD